MRIIFTSITLPAALCSQTRRSVAGASAATCAAEADCSFGMRLDLDEWGNWRAADVLQGGPADCAGLRAGDIIAAIDFRSLEVRQQSRRRSREGAEHPAFRAIYAGMSCARPSMSASIHASSSSNPKTPIPTPKPRQIQPAQMLTLPRRAARRAPRGRG